MPGLEERMVNVSTEDQSLGTVQLNGELGADRKPAYSPPKLEQQGKWRNLTGVSVTKLPGGD
jgi:hypothetical protein